MYCVCISAILSHAKHYSFLLMIVSSMLSGYWNAAVSTDVDSYLILWTKFIVFFFFFFCLFFVGMNFACALLFLLNSLFWLVASHFHELSKSWSFSQHHLMCLIAHCVPPLPSQHFRMEFSSYLCKLPSSGFLVLTSYLVSLPSVFPLY